jgi:hypothetical protein
LPQEVGSGKLVVGILQNMDIASNITQALNMGVDIDRSKQILADLQVEVNKTLATAQDLAKYAMKDGYSIVSYAIKQFPQTYRFLAQQQMNQLMQSAAGFRITGSLMAQYSKLYAQNNFADLYDTIIFDMPETYVKEKVSRFYNAMFLNAILPAGFATEMYNKGKINEQKWRDILNANGVPDVDKTLLLDASDKKPEMGTLLRMYQFIDMPDSAIEWLMTENGISMSQVRTLWKRYFHANRLRDEMLEYKSYLKAAYQDGILTDEQLETELASFKASQEEIDQIVTTQKSEFLRTLMRTEFQTRLWLYRQGVYNVDYQILVLEAAGYVDCVPSDHTKQVQVDGIEVGILQQYNNNMHTWIVRSSDTILEDTDITITDGTGAGTASDDSVLTVDAEGTLYEALLLLGVNSALVNATVRFEAAKKGIDWEKE